MGISTIPYAASFGQKSSVQNNLMFVTFEDLAKNVSISKVTRRIEATNESVTEYYYAFTTPFPQWTKKLSKDVGVPPNIQYSSVDADGELQENKNIELQFYLGPAGSGAPMHFHGHALNTLAYGMEFVNVYSVNYAGCLRNEALVHIPSVSRLLLHSTCIGIRKV